MVAVRRFLGRLNLDMIGFSASALCAVHCVAFPLLMLFGALGSTAIVHNHDVENVVLLFGGVVSIASLIPSYRNSHRKAGPLLVFVVGILLILGSRLAIPALWEVALTTTGATAVAYAHLLNWRIVRVTRRCHIQQ